MIRVINLSAGYRMIKSRREREEAGRAFVKGMMDFVLCICISKQMPNCILTLKNVL